MKIELLDTTLRDGSQGERISFSVRDKLAVTEALDQLGVSWIEAGNPGSNPKDMEFFRLASSLKLEHAKLCAFGSTRKKGRPPEKDSRLKNLLSAGTEAVVIFGKSWDLHVTEVLHAELDENIAMIAETVAFLKERGRTVIFDAEHFFDGWKANPAYALSTLKAAAEAGAARIGLCDTNGGAFPDFIAKGTGAACRALGLLPGSGKGAKGASRNAEIRVGIHAHNDSGMACANTVMALEAGCTHVQGTLVGFGERCGNTALAAVIPSIELKLKKPCLPPGNLARLSELSWKVAEIANVAIPDNLPYVGRNAFAHKAGMHADGILKLRRSFEHIEPSSVGNKRRFPMSEVGGRSAIAERARKIDPSITRDHPLTALLSEKLKELEASGWQFEGADASFELLVRRLIAEAPAGIKPPAGTKVIAGTKIITGTKSPAGTKVIAGVKPPAGAYKALFKILAYRVVSEHPTGSSIACSHAWVKVLVDGRDEIAAAEGNGPVHALDGALRRALIHFYAELRQVRLLDYKVRVIDGNDATAAKVRVLIESSDGLRSWSTVGVSDDIIDASRAALVDSIEYKLIIDRENGGCYTP
ncbi:MAG: citramalate synthase [Spirochaetaceae bacterium]|jgi:2-isopropylmalate synthase|nr:citramalate synthase [Spirochaetaceae bacterium]